MHILIENDETHEFLAAEGRWTKDPHAGKRFNATEAANQMAKREAIGRFNIVGHFAENHQFVNLDHGRGKGLPAV